MFLFIKDKKNRVMYIYFWRHNFLSSNKCLPCLRAYLHQQSSLWRSPPAASSPWLTSPPWMDTETSAGALPPCARSPSSPPIPASPARRWPRSPAAWRPRNCGTSSTSWAPRWSSPSLEGRSGRSSSSLSPPQQQQQQQ